MYATRRNSCKEIGIICTTVFWSYWWKFDWHSYDSKLSIACISYHISLRTRCCGLHFSGSKFGYIFNRFYVMRLESCSVRWKNAKYGPFRRSGSFKVTDFGTNRKLIIFLLVINTNLSRILHRFGDTAFQMSKIAIFGWASPLAVKRRVSPGTISAKYFPWMSTDGQGTKRRRKIAENFNRLSYRQTTDRQTDRR